MRAFLLLGVVFGVGLALMHAYPEKAMEFHIVKTVMQEVRAFDQAMSGRGWVCAIPEVRAAVDRVAPSACRKSAAFSVGPGRRSPAAALLVKVGWNIGAAALFGGLGLGVWAVVRMVMLLYGGGGEISYRVRWWRLFRKQVYRAAGASDVRLKRSAWVLPSCAYARVCELRIGHREVCVDLLRFVEWYRKQTYRVGRGRDEGAFGRHVLMIYAGGMKIADEMALGIEAKGMLSVCLLSQELGKLGAFDRSGMADWFSFAGPAHQSKSAGVLRSLASFGRLPVDEQEAILRLVAGHHEELLPDGTHRGIRILRSILRRAEHYRDELVGAVEATA